MENKTTDKVFEDLSKMSLNETSDLLISCKSKEEAGFYKQICENVLQKRQKEVIEKGKF